MKISAVIGFVLIMAFGFGWVRNLVKLAEADFEPSYKEEVIRGVGIVIAPVGAIAGYIDFDDSK